MTTEIVKKSTNIDELQRFAKMAEAAGIFASADLKGFAQACIKIQAGAEIGLAPIQSLNSIHIVEGRPTLSANCLAALMKRAGYSWKILRHDAEVCVILMRDQRGEELGESTFSMEMAARAGLSSRANWKRFPEAMLFARAIAQAARWYAPEVAIGIYERSELEDENGEESA